MRGRPSTHSKEISRTNVHSNHHRTHNQPEPTPSIHNPTSQQPRHANFPQRRQPTPHHHGRRETLLHVAGRQKDPRPRAANDSRPSVPCRPGTAFGRMTPTGPGPKSSRAVGWRRSWTCRSFRPPRMSCPWLSLRATSSKGYASGPREDVCRRIGRGCIRGWKQVERECGGCCGRIEAGHENTEGSRPVMATCPPRVGIT